MRVFLQEYGVGILGGLIGILCLLILFSPGAFLDTVERLEPEKSNVKNDVIVSKLAALSKREKPIMIYLNEPIHVGDEVCIADLVVSARDGEGRDIRERVRYYLTDGTEVQKDYKIPTDKAGNYLLQFYAEDEKGVSTDEKLSVWVIPDESGWDEKELVEEWKIGVVKETVRAGIYKVKRQQDKKDADKDVGYQLRITGSGAAAKFRNRDEVPWLKKYSSLISECVIDKEVTTSDISFWFSGCTSLKTVPELTKTFQMESSFEGCTQLIYGQVPPEAINLNRTFKNCTALRTMGNIPAGVTNMEELFAGCVQLRGNLVIEADPIAYTHCFYLDASQTGGISLKVYAGSESSSSTLKRMIMDEIGEMNGSDVRYMGVWR